MLRSFAVGAAIAIVLVACGDDGQRDLADGPPSAEIVTTTVRPATTSAPSTTEPAATAAPSTTTSSATATEPRVGDPVVRAERVAEHDQPLDLAVRPGDPALYLVGQGGTIARVEPGTDDGTIVLDRSGRVSDGNEQGLLGLEFSPDGDLAYVDFTDPSGTTVIAEYPVGPDGVLDPAGEREVLRVEQPYSNHNAGDLAFGPDGMLYITLGDGGSGGDPERRASDPRSLLGSLLRIDPTPTDSAAYTIPADNPFADGVDGAPEVWAWGLRNPWKIAFDPVTDDLWIADVGQNLYEEINRVSPADGLPAGWGVNFGWSALEGTEPYNADVSSEGSTLPVLTYDHEDGCSVSGGVPYRGTAIADLEPAYVFSDHCSGVIWALDLAGDRVLTLLTGFQQVNAVRAGPDGELYVLERTGGVYRLVPG